MNAAPASRRRATSLRVPATRRAYGPRGRSVTFVTILDPGAPVLRTPPEEEKQMKLWVFIQCPRCGFPGCTAPINESLCPRCGYREPEAPSGAEATAPAA